MGIDRLTIKGFKSIQNLDRFPLRPLNILIGSNGSGKSNLISYFRMLGEMMEGRLQSWTTKQGSADRILSFGVSATNRIVSSLEFTDARYDFSLEPTADGGFVYAREILCDSQGEEEYDCGAGHKESELKASLVKNLPLKIGTTSRPRYPSTMDRCYYELVRECKVFHFHDTSETARVKRWGSLHDNVSLRSDASNLAAYLYKLSIETPNIYKRIRDIVRLAIPFFDDFVLRPRPLDTGEEQIWLLWRQKNSDYEFWPSQLSDGSVRFICLATALLQPDPPSTIVIDEPELGLHPYAVTLLASLLRSASVDTQVIVATQSVPLVDEFSIHDLIIVERENDASVFTRKSEEDFAMWLEDYSVGELWEKNILGGRPPR